MKKIVVNKIIEALFALCLLLPVLLFICEMLLPNVFQKRTLGGYVETSTIPVFSFDNYKTGTFQGAVSD